VPEDSSPVSGSLLAFLSADDREAMVRAGSPRRFAAQEVVLRQGDPTDHVFVLLSGWVRVVATTAEGNDLLLAFRGPGDVIGEMAAVLGRDRSASVRTMEAVAGVQLRREQYLALLDDRPSVALGMIKQLSVRLLEAGEARASSTTLDVTQRVAACLVRLMDDHGVVTSAGVALRIPLSQADVASRVDASARSVARAYAVLRDRGIVTSRRGRVLIARPEVLRAFLA
jgi:CRP/FNR family transcriptional regulator, cyclic AMP receptor protein